MARGAEVTLTPYRAPRLALARFTASRLARGGALWGVVIGFYTYATANGYNELGPGTAARDRVLSSFADNTGLKALMGEAHRITTITGFTDWRVLGVASLVVSIWALLAATRAMRGEETAGRWELFLAGRTTGRRAAASALAGLGAGAAAMYVAVIAVTALAGRLVHAGFSPGGVALFGLAAVASGVMFLAVGALTSELMPTRSRAAGAAAAVFGVSFMLRAVGDSATSAHWLVNLSPLGWVEQVRPLGDPQPLWLIPAAGLTAACVLLTLSLAGRRDLGASLLADKDSAAPRLSLLSSPLRLAVRLSWPVIVSWLAAIAAAGLLYGSIAKTAGQAFAASGVLRKLGGTLTAAATHDAQLLGSKTYAGVVFLMIMTVIMVYAATAVSKMREDESEGYLDNLLVRSVSRTRWLAGRAGLAAAVTVAAGILGALGFWAGAASQQAGLSVRELLMAGLNSAAPAILLLGIGVLAFGFVPRLTAVLCYALIAWSFLLEMLSSAVNISHWLLDTSLLHTVTLAPAVDPDWRVAGTFLAAGCGAAVLGAWRFTRRDLAAL